MTTQAAQPADRFGLVHWPLYTVWVKDPVRGWQAVGGSDSLMGARLLQQTRGGMVLSQGERPDDEPSAVDPRRGGR